MQIAKVQNEEHKVVLVHISCNSSILRKPRKCLFTYFSVYLQNKAVISSDNYWLITIVNYIQSHFFSSSNFDGSHVSLHQLSLWPLKCILSITISVVASFWVMALRGCLHTFCANFRRWHPSS